MDQHNQIIDISPRIQYTGDGAQTAFTFPFPIFADGDIRVYAEDTPQTLTGDYTVSGAGESGGGTVTFLSPPGSGTTITLRRDLTVERNTDFQESGEFRAKVINDELDRIVAMIQEAEDAIGRTLRLSPTETVAALELPAKASRAGNFLGFDANGDPVASAGSVDTVSVSTFMETVLGDVSAAAARTTLGVAIGSDVLAPDGNGSSLSGVAAPADVRLAFLLIAENAGDRVNMIDGIVDPFADETDVDTATSTNENYDAAGDYYSPLTRLTGATPSTPTGTGGTPANINDDDPTTTSTTSSVGDLTSEADINNRMLFKLDFGSNRNIDRIDLVAAHSTSFSSVWGFYTSTDGTTWAQFGTSQGVQTTSADYSTSAATVSARYVGVALAQANYTGMDFVLGDLNVHTQANMTLVSNAFTADAAPATGRIHVQVFENDAVTVNTDLTAEISRDGGATWTAATLVRKQTLADGTAAYEDDSVDISAQPSGTSMKWRIKTLNNKDIDVHGVVLQWT